MYVTILFKKNASVYCVQTNKNFFSVVPANYAYLILL